MTLIQRLSASDEELGKRDDKYKPPRNGSWGRWRIPLRYRKKRVITTLLVIALIWIVLYRLPQDLVSNPFSSPSFDPIYDPTSEENEPKGPPPRESGKSAKEQHYYEGLIRFFRLASSLHQLSQTSGYSSVNRNILFAAASLKSASALIPMACEMTRWDRNHVHVAIMGRDNLSMREIQEINGVNLSTCKVFWHDARPDYSEYSNDVRAEATVGAAMNHMQTYMHPQAIIVDDSADEEQWFIRAIRKKAKKFGRPLIAVPGKDAERLMWLTHLDSGALTSWHKPSIDILIHAPAKGSGSLMRLLKSIQKADYSGFAVPHITIDLPVEIDPPTEVFLQHMEWPPSDLAQPGMQRSQLSIHRRIPSRKAGPEEASGRFLESFYPTDDAHILVLSPQAEVSPAYFHYLQYTLLEYKYSSFGFSEGFRQKLAGISLQVPSTYLNGTAPFELPQMRHAQASGYTQKQADIIIPFLWEAPDSNAALYFADKWREIHSFMTNRIRAEHAKKHPAARPKVISQHLPAWTEYLLELMRVRGYNIMFPAKSQTEPFVTIHNDLYQPPEEFTGKDSDKDQAAESSVAPNPNEEPFLPPVEPATIISSYIEPTKTSTYLPLHHVLPFEADLPDLPDLPYLSYNGTHLKPSDMIVQTKAYSLEFRHKVGGCNVNQDSRKRKIVTGSARDLFCFGDEDERDFVDPQPISDELLDELQNWRDPNTPYKKKKPVDLSVPADQVPKVANGANAKGGTVGAAGGAKGAGTAAGMGRAAGVKAAPAPVPASN